MVVGLPTAPRRAKNTPRGFTLLNFEDEVARSSGGHWDNSSATSSGPAGLFLCSDAMTRPHGDSLKGISQGQVGQTLFLSSANSLEKNKTQSTKRKEKATAHVLSGYDNNNSSSATDMHLQRKQCRVTEC